MKNLRVFLIIAGLSFVSAASVPALESQLSSEIEFAQIWGLVKKNAPGLRAAYDESEAAQINKDRVARHWYPRIYATAKIFSTNDPAISFMNTLEQRQIGAVDFAPSSLNQPGSSLFKQGTLGLDLPLYEGGIRQAQTQAAEKLAEAKSWENKAQVISMYARVAHDYASLLVLIEEHKQLAMLRESVSGILNHYSIGSKSNPVGYSGLLGLKNLRNRIDGLLIENVARADSKKNDIRSVAVDVPGAWQPKVSRAKDFLARAFPVVSVSEVSRQKRNLDLSLPVVRAALSGAESLDHAKDGEKARFLPRVGVFAQGDLYSGSRASANSYMSGAYLQWDLFTASNFGAMRQSELQAAAARARAEELQSKMISDQASAEGGASAAEKNLMLLDESAKFLEEQTQTASSLFKNGSINVLQLVEVLSRRSELLMNRAEAELNFSQMKAALFVTTTREGVPDDHAH